jgi:hypothetical protein
MLPRLTFEGCLYRATGRPDYHYDYLLILIVANIVVSWQ